MDSDFLQLNALSHAIETRNSAALRGFYADDARMMIVDCDHPPSRPMTVSGGPAIAAYFDDVCGRMMTHKVSDAMLDGDHLAFKQDCTYPDGKRVLCSTIADLKDGKIARQTIVQAWDA